MADTSDVYKTIAKPCRQILFKDKKSKFYGYAFPIESENQTKPLIEAIQRKHPTANHVCYAWQLGVEDPFYRTHDDGEPNNSAGIPIYGQIRSFGVTDILIAVARVFGGTKLGVGGLVTAYRATAKLTLESSKIIKRTLRQNFTLAFKYPEMDVVMRTIGRNRLEIISQKFEMDCEIVVSVRKRDALSTKEIFEGIHKVEIV